MHIRDETRQVLIGCKAANRGGEAGVYLSGPRIRLKAIASRLEAAAGWVCSSQPSEGALRSSGFLNF